MVTTINKAETLSTADYVFHNGFTCGESVVYTLNKCYELGLPESAIAISSGFPYGFGDGGSICGAVAGGTIILGAIFGRTSIEDPLPEKCLALTRELHDYVAAHHKSTICPELIADYNFSTSERKEACTEIVMHTIECIVNIMERECNIQAI